MGRPKTGHVQWRGGEWKTRVPDSATGVKKWVGLQDHLPSEQRLKPEQKKIAQQMALILQRNWERDAIIPRERLCVNDFFKLWTDSRIGRYRNQVEADRTAYRLWISDQLGTLPMHAVSRDHLIAFSHWLDTKAAEGDDFGGKRARNIFSVVSAMFRDAFSSKDPTIRILDANPCDGVPWPDKPDGDPLHQLLYPNEFSALVSCPFVPLVRARLYAVALFTTTRVGEARVLECKDIDLEHGLVRIVKASDSGKASKGKTKLTKSGRSRICTLEETLAPMLEAMVSFCGGKGRLFPDRPAHLPKGNQYDRQPTEYIHGTSKVCEIFRRDLRRALEWAGIKERPELYDDSNLRESQPVRFHDLRASGITWRHARGDNPSVIRQECGHQDERTNEIYIRRLRELRPDELFAPLPDRLNAPENKDQIVTSGPYESQDSAEILCRRRESKTRRTSPNMSRIVALRGESGRGIGSAGVSPDTTDDGSAQVATALAIALRAAAEAGQWDVVSELSRQLAALRQAPVLRAVERRRG